MHAWRQCRCLEPQKNWNIISCMPRGNWNRPLFVQIQTLPSSMHHDGSKLLIVYAKQPMNIVRDQLLMESSIDSKENSSVVTYSSCYNTHLYNVNSTFNQWFIQHCFDSCFVILVGFVHTKYLKLQLICWRGSPRGRSHQPLLTPSISISGYNSVKNDGPTSLFEHNPQQFHGWNWTESLVWAGHESMLEYTDP